MTDREIFEVETVTSLAKRWGVTRGRIHQLIVAGHFGFRARRLGRDWIIMGFPPPFDFMKKKDVDITLDRDIV